MPDNEQNIMTIGDNFELKVWNYVTGNTMAQGRIEMGRDLESMRNV